MDTKSSIEELQKKWQRLVKVAGRIGKNYRQDSAMSDEELRLYSNNRKIGEASDGKHESGISCYLGRSHPSGYTLVIPQI